MIKMAVNLIGIFLAFVLVSNVRGEECPSPENVGTMEDVRDALRAVTFLQSDIKVGSTIPGTKFDVKYLDKEGGGVQIMSAEFGNSIILAFKAPDRAEEKFMKDQFDFLKHFGLQEVSFNDKEMKVSRSLYNSYNHVEPKVKKLLEGVSESKRFIVTGYSIGGSMASLVALFMSNNKLFNNARSSLITFGQTRVGDVNFAKAHDDVILPWRKLRFVFKGDPVTKIPPYKQWVHHSRAVYLGNEKTKISTKLRKRSDIPSSLSNANASAEINEYDRAALVSQGGTIDDIDAGIDHENGIDDEEESHTLSEEKSYEESERMLNGDDEKLVQNFNHTDESEKIMDEVEAEEEEREENEMNNETNDGGMSENVKSGNSMKLNASTSEKEMSEYNANIDQDESDSGENKNHTIGLASNEETIEKQSEMGSEKSGTISGKYDNETESFITEERIPEGESETGSGKSKTIDPKTGNGISTFSKKEESVKLATIDYKETDPNKMPKFLQICAEKEDSLCVVKHENLISTINDHDLSNYLDHLLQGPGEYLTRKGTRKFSLEEASLATCDEKKESIGKSSH